MNAPQIVMIVIIALGLGFSLAKHGQPRENHNLTKDCISTAILLAILWWGGFFT